MGLHHVVLMDALRGEGGQGEEWILTLFQWYETATCSEDTSVIWHRKSPKPSYTAFGTKHGHEPDLPARTVHFTEIFAVINFYNSAKYTVQYCIGRILTKTDICWNKPLTNNSTNEFYYIVYCENSQIQLCMPLFIDICDCYNGKSCLSISILHQHPKVRYYQVQ